MDPQILFQWMSFSPGPIWLALAIAPQNRWTHRVVDLFILMGATLFTINLAPDVVELIPVIAKPTFEAIQGLLTSPSGLAGTWTHMVVADVWMGRWIAQKANSMGWNRLATLPFLAITLFFGPVGVVCFLVTRAVWTRNPNNLWVSH